MSKIQGQERIPAPSCDYSWIEYLQDKCKRIDDILSRIDSARVAAAVSFRPPCSHPFWAFLGAEDAFDKRVQAKVRERLPSSVPLWGFKPDIIRIIHQIQGGTRFDLDHIWETEEFLRTNELNNHRESYNERIRLLEEMHSNLASILRVDAAKLLQILPRELRDRIYEQLYTTLDVDRTNGVPHYIETIPLWIRERKDFSGHPHFLTRDPYMFLSARHVGAVVAAEAAKVMYSSNTFAITDGEVDKFLETDHYGSGLLPKDVVRSLAILNDTAHFFEMYSEAMDDDKFEDKHRPGAMDWVTMELPTRMPKLKSIELHIANDYPHGGDGGLDLRYQSRVVFTLKAHGIRVAVKRCTRENETYTEFRHPWSHCRDISEYFEEPTDEDRLVVAEYERKRNSVSILHPWVAPTSPGAWFRIKLKEHYEVYRTRAEHRTELAPQFPQPSLRIPLCSPSEGHYVYYRKQPVSLVDGELLG